MRTLAARRVLHADRRGSSWPVLVETDEGLWFTKLRGAGQGTAPLVAEVVVGALAEAIELNVPERVVVLMPADVESLDRRDELRDLLTASEGENLGFAYLDGARDLTANDLGLITPDEAAMIVWLDTLVMNPDRTARNPNLLWWHDRLWLIDHGAALSFHYAWASVTEASTRLPHATFEPHLLRDRAVDLAAWDELLAPRLTREVITEAIASIPDSFLTPLLRVGDLADKSDALRRSRASYAAFLWKRLKEPRTFFHETPPAPSAKRGVRPAWLNRPER